jgi:hypothetical protein
MRVMIACGSGSIWPLAVVMIRLLVFDPFKDNRNNSAVRF